LWLNGGQWRNQKGELVVSSLSFLSPFIPLIPFPVFSYIPYSCPFFSFSLLFFSRSLYLARQLKPDREPGERGKLRNGLWGGDPAEIAFGAL